MDKLKLKIILLTVLLIPKNLFSSNPFPWVTFNESMMISPTYTKEFVQKDPYWQIIQKIYAHFVLHYSTSKTETRIPKIIHQIWLGSPLPQKYIYFIDSWKKHHPDWQHILWTDKEINELGLTNKARYEATRNMGERSDIARYEIIYRFGGLYVDTDFECLQPFDILHTSCDFYTGIASDKEFNTYNGLLAAMPGDPILKYCIDQLSYTIHPSSNIYEIIENTGPLFFAKCIKAMLPILTNQSILFPLTYFYPWPGGNRFENSRPEIERWFRPESFAVHHWHTSWQKSKHRSDQFSQYIKEQYYEQI